MSEKVARRAVSVLRIALPPAMRDIGIVFPLVKDPFAPTVDQVPNILAGQIQDLGANVATPLVTVYAEGPAEGVVNQYRHLSLHVDIWTGGTSASNIDGRRMVSIIYEYVFRALQNVDWSGDKVLIARSYEIERSAILFEPANKFYHISNTYRVEALSKTWY
jgi:hypothetical protein